MADEANQCPQCRAPTAAAFAPYCSEACSKEAGSSTNIVNADIEQIRKQLPPRAALELISRGGMEVVMIAAGESKKIGRMRPAQIVIADPSLSREHARVSFEGDRITIVDLGSTNGTFVNGEKLPRDKPRQVKLGEDVVLGSVLARVQLLGRDDDKPSGALSHDRFVDVIGEEILRARTLRRDVSLVFIGSTREGARVDSFVHDVQKALRPIDKCGVYSLGLLEVLLPEHKLEEALAFAQRLTSKRRDLSLGVASYPGSAANVDDLIDAAHEAHNAVRRKGGVASARASERKADDKSEVIVASPQMEKLWHEVTRFAQKSMSVLVLGEAGSGKEVVARELHARGPRAKAKLKSLNCAALSPNLMESELFGTVEGAYTGAVNRAGPFEEASGGTVFLDEIGELPIGMQAKLLRVLEQKIVVRVGSTKEVPVDFRLVAATNKNLRDMIAKGEFRQDLFDRLNGADLRVPPLRERTAEILPLAKLFLSRCDDGKTIEGFDEDADQALLNYRWPGNVRELRNAVERAAAIASPPCIKLEDLPELVRLDVPDAGAPRADEYTSSGDDHKKAMEHIEAQRMLEALRKAGWKPGDAAAALGMPRRTFDFRLRKLRIRRQPDGHYAREPESNETANDNQEESDRRES